MFTGVPAFLHVTMMPLGVIMAGKGLWVTLVATVSIACFFLTIDLVEAFIVDLGFHWRCLFLKVLNNILHRNVDKVHKNNTTGVCQVRNLFNYLSLQTYLNKNSAISHKRHTMTHLLPRDWSGLFFYLSGYANEIVLSSSLYQYCCSCCIWRETIDQIIIVLKKQRTKLISWPPQNLQLSSKTEAIETVGTRQSKHKEVSKENSLMRLGNTRKL